MQAAIDRLSQISDRLDSRIEKLSTEGVQTATAAEILGHVETELSEAKGALLEMRPDVENAVTSDDPRKTFRNVRSQFLIAAHSIRDAQTHLRTAIQLIKEATDDEGRPDGSMSASSTPTEL
jgi:hypothetical protein